MESKEIARRALAFSVRMIRLYGLLTAAGGAARALAPQILRSSTSVGANLEEAMAGQTKADFIAKVSIARKEARETVYWLRLVAAAGLVSADAVAWELDEAAQLAAILGAIVLRAQSNPNRGNP